MNNFKVSWLLFLKSASMQKKRAFLTVAAIAWGTVAILLLLAFGQGLKEQLMKSKRGMGENLAVIWPGRTSKVWMGLPTGRPVYMRMNDVNFLRERLPKARIVGEMTAWNTNLAWGKKVVNGPVIGVNWEFGSVRNHYAKIGGRFLDPMDEIEKRRVVFLGDSLAREIFGDVDPVGKKLEINDAPYTVIGVMRHKLQMGSYSIPDEKHAVIPITTFSAQMGELYLNNLVVKVKDPREMAGVLERLDKTMGAKYRFDPTDEQALGTWNTVKSSKIMANIMLGIQLFLGFVGALTLLIGGVGVANIMYAVVKEKTREIGIQMAIGARRGWITGPFILQGVMYTLLGGALGVVMAVVLVAGMDLIPTQGNEALEMLGKPTLSLPIGLATALILGIIGLMAGYFPARRAAEVDPAETLRYE